MKAAVREFFAWAVEAGVVDGNAARSIRMHRLPNASAENRLKTLVVA